jgi:hypothetical protein
MQIVVINGIETDLCEGTVIQLELVCPANQICVCTDWLHLGDAKFVNCTVLVQASVNLTEVAKP